MEVILSQFIRSLTASGLMTADEVQSFLGAMPDDDRPGDGAALARALVRRGKLTRFQAQAIYQGKTRGLILGDYVVLDRIGQGGMGQVYKARHKVMKRLVALKTLPSAATRSARAVQRFHREVEVAARLSHPNIVTAYDAREDHGIHFLVMEHVEGENLAKVLKKRGPLPIQTALNYILQAAHGLEYAHSHQVIHRDIKPSNLVLDSEGTVKILDMGLARLGQALGPNDSTAEDTLTGTGEAMGTIDYMPPEQAENTKSVDQRADIYSLGCTLYSLLTGRSLYGGDTTVAKLLAHRESPIPSLCDRREDVSLSLDAVFQKMVAKSPDDRYRTMTDAIAALQACAHTDSDPLADTDPNLGLPGVSIQRGHDVTLGPDDTPGEQSLPLDFPIIAPMDGLLKPGHHQPDFRRQMLLGLVVVPPFLLLIAIAAFLAFRNPSGTLTVHVSQAGATVQAKDEDGEVASEQISDGRPLVLSLRPGTHELSVSKRGFQPFSTRVTIAVGEEKQVTATLQPAAPPRRVASASGGGSDGESGTQASPDAGTQASDSDDFPLTDADADVTADQVRLLHTLEGHTDRVSSVTFTPDGYQLVSGSPDKTVRLWCTVTGHFLETWTEWPEIVRSVDINSDGSLLIVAGNRPSEVWDMAARQVLTSLDRPEGNQRFSATGFSARFSPDGKYLAIGSVLQLRLHQAPDWSLIHTITLPDELNPSTNTSANVSDVSFSGDSRRVAFLAENMPDEESAATRHTSLCLWDIGAATYEHDISIPKDAVGCIEISQDGSLMASGNRLVIELRDAASGEIVKQLEGHAGYVTSSEFAAGGTVLATGDAKGSVRLWHLPNGELLASLSAHTAEVRDLRFSPDGRLLASCSDDKSIKIWDVSAHTHPEDFELHRRTAEWVLDAGASIGIEGMRERTRLRSQLPQRNFTIRYIDFPPDPVRSSFPDDWSEKIAVLPALRGIGLNNVAVTDAELRTIAGIRRLRGLLIWGAKIDDASCQYIVQAWPFLESLNVGSTAITDVGLESLSALRHLSALHLNRTRITDEGLQHFARLKYLRTLDLGETQVTNVGLEHLTPLTSLQLLKLNGAGVTAAGIASLQAALPKCVIVADVDSAKEAPLPDPSEGGRAEDEADTNTASVDDAASDSPVRFLHVLEGHTEKVESLAFLPDTYELISGSSDTTVRLWDANAGVYVRTLVEWPQKVYTVDVSSDGGKLLIAGPSRDAEVWDLETLTSTASLKWVPGPRMSQTGFDAAFSPDGQYAAVGSVMELRLYGAPEWNLATTIPFPPTEPDDPRSAFLLDLDFAPDSTRLAYTASHVRDEGTGKHHTKVAVWNMVESKHELELLIDEQGAPVSFAPDSTTIARSDWNAVAIHNVASGLTVDLQGQQNKAVLAIAYSPDGNFLAAGNYAGTVEVWRLADRTLLATLTGHTSGVRINDICFSHDGRLLASCSDDKTIRVWDVSALTRPEDFELHRRTAEWILDSGGALRIIGRSEWIEDHDHLPSEPFKIQELAFHTDKVRRKQVPDTWAEKAASLRTLKSIGMNASDVTDRHLRTLGRLLPLTSLMIHGASIDDTTCRYIIQTWPGIQTLNAGSTAITDVGVKHLTAVPYWRKLFLSATQITDAGLQHLTGMTSLRDLCLRDTQVTDAGLAHLKTLSRLQLLELEGTQVTAAGVAELQGALPNCRIMWDGATPTE